MRSRYGRLFFGAMLVAAAVWIAILIAGVAWLVSNILELTQMGF
jgi:hypothetical protein